MGIDSRSRETTFCLFFKLTLTKSTQCYQKVETEFAHQNFLFGIDLNVFSGSCRFMVEMF